MESDRNLNSQPEKEKQEPVGLLQEIILTLKIFFVATITSIYRFFIPPKRKSVNGEIVLITGSGSGMGRQLAVEFGKLGAILVLWDIDETSNFQTAEIIRQNGSKCYTYKCNVGSREEIYHVGKQVKEEVGEVTYLINNAGVVTGKRLVNCPDHMIERTFNVNLLAYFWTVKCFLPSMMMNNHGHIVNIASSTGLVGLNKLVDYSATKIWYCRLVFSGYNGIHTTLVCPSFVKTGMFEGCEMRFPWVIPPLDKKKTVDRIMQAILTNQHMLCIPKLIYFFAFLKTILPVAAFCEICRFFGSATFMDTYKGRDLPSPQTDLGTDTPSSDYINGFRDVTREINGKVKTT
ncbi:hypothetical protein KUTeg_000545 [Tegillarca granosa]|uniref:Uncharacterized protein n=1 Tax=Tegillarca granosa TaxID=220873 RepID=A0ABQ9FXV6_TEGGR|nr:hypothetical protein KUTeg_000545 [Tegillarca granosa]